jgi:molybdopterin-containing oxidoreductase family iron-sulfur binding subunit
VRRFNFFEFNQPMNGKFEHPIALSKNPEVTIRSRGVMEKCSFCVQRIEAGKSTAKREGRPLKDGEVKSACQLACPAEAITFGDMNDPSSQIAKIRKDPRGFEVLEELNTKPALRYLTKVWNRPPEAKDAGKHGGGH